MLEPNSSINMIDSTALSSRLVEAAICTKHIYTEYANSKPVRTSFNIIDQRYNMTVSRHPCCLQNFSLSERILPAAKLRSKILLKLQIRKGEAETSCNGQVGAQRAKRRLLQTTDRAYVQPLQQRLSLPNRPSQPQTPVLQPSRQLACYLWSTLAECDLLLNNE